MSIPHYPRPPAFQPAGMSLEAFLITLMVAGYLLQFAGFAGLWLTKKAPKRVAKRWGSLSRIDPLFTVAIWGAGFCASMAWPLLAADVGAWPAAAVNYLQRAVLGLESYWVTFFTLEIVASPILVAIVVVAHLAMLGVLKPNSLFVRVFLWGERRKRRR